MKGVTLSNISKTYPTPSGDVHAVGDVSLAVAPGEFFFLLGPSGCGKTTLLRIVAGLIEPTAGRVRFGERDVTDQPVQDRNTAMVFQNYALWPHMTVGQNVEFGPKMRGAVRAERRRRAAENLQRVQMDGYDRRKPNQLSGGQQQRVALARALAAEPDCLLLDEPLSNLDARLRLHMRGELRRLVKSTGTTAVYVTHDQKEALSMADRIAVMTDGRVAQVGTPEGLYHHPATRFVADFLGEANFLPGRVIGCDAGLATVETAAGTLRAALVEPGGAAGGDEAAGASPPSGEVTCCVRPERVTFADRRGDGPNRLPAKVIGATYLGELRQYACRMTDGSQWRVTELAGPTPARPVDQDVLLDVDPAAVTLLSE